MLKSENPWDAAGRNVLVRRDAETGEDTPLEPGVNFFVLMLERLGATTRFSCEGHPEAFYVVFEGSPELARSISHAGFFTMEIWEGEADYAMRISEHLFEEYVGAWSDAARKGTPPTRCCSLGGTIWAARIRQIIEPLLSWERNYERAWIARPPSNGIRALRAGLRLGLHNLEGRRAFLRRQYQLLCKIPNTGGEIARCDYRVKWRTVISYPTVEEVRNDENAGASSAAR